MKKWLLGTSWQTSLVGYLVAVGNLMLGGMDWKHALGSAAIALFGRMTTATTVTGTDGGAVNTAPGTATMVSPDVAAKP